MSRLAGFLCFQRTSSSIAARSESSLSSQSCHLWPYWTSYLALQAALPVKHPSPFVLGDWSSNDLETLWVLELKSPKSRQEPCCDALQKHKWHQNRPNSFLVFFSRTASPWFSGSCGSQKWAAAASALSAPLLVLLTGLQLTWGLGPLISLSFIWKVSFYIEENALLYYW